MSLNTPIVLLIFNRPETTKKVFAEVRKVQPSQLFVVADGARFPEEEEKCQQARATIIDNIDWDCKVLTNFSDVNLTSPICCSSGLNWAFSLVEEAIVLEDDCLPTASFFSFCETLLNYYRDDLRIMQISGTNFSVSHLNQDFPYSYYFSKYPRSWGWASWRRAWQYFDFEMKSWYKYRKTNKIKEFFEDSYEQKYWSNVFDRSILKSDFHWDYSWLYSCQVNKGLSIVPKHNLISNIGHGADATHSKDENDTYANLPTKDIWEIKHPPIVEIDKEADAHTFDYVFGGKQLKENDTFYRRFRWRLSKTKQDIMKFLNIHRESRE